LSACGDKVYNKQQKNVTNVSETKSKIKNTQVSRDIRSTTSLPKITYDEVLQKVKLYSDIDFFKDGKPNDEYIAFLKNDIRINFSYMRSSRTSLAREKHAIDNVVSSLYIGMYNIYDFKQTEKLIKFHREHQIKNNQTIDDYFKGVAMQYGTDKNNFNIAEKFDDLYNVNSSVVREVPETNLYEVIVRGVDYNGKEIVGSFYTNKNVDFLIKVHNWLSSPDSINYYSDKSLLNVATMSKNLYLSDIRKQLNIKSDYKISDKYDSDSVEDSKEQVFFKVIAINSAI
jgi:hypothetical protein